MACFLQVAFQPFERNKQLMMLILIEKCADLERLIELNLFFMEHLDSYSQLCVSFLTLTSQTN